jgi:hypothetical protein
MYIQNHQRQVSKAKGMAGALIRVRLDEIDLVEIRQEKTSKGICDRFTNITVNDS